MQAMNTAEIETERHHARKGENERSPELQKSSREKEEATATEKRFLKVLHWMRCPKCGQALVTERHSAVDIDVCPDCQEVCLNPAALEAIAAPENEFLRSCLRKLRRPNLLQSKERRL